MKTGTVTSYNAEKGVGVIYVNSVVGEQYFFYTNHIVSGQPSVGSQVIFKVSIKKSKPGQFPYAAQIIVLPSPNPVGQILDAAKGGTE
jgi:cold shock CspA family protein